MTARREEELRMDPNGFVVLPGHAPVLEMSTAGRSATLMLQSDAIGASPFEVG